MYLKPFELYPGDFGDLKPILDDGKCVCVGDLLVVLQQPLQGGGPYLRAYQGMVVRVVSTTNELSMDGLIAVQFEEGDAKTFKYFPYRFARPPQRTSTWIDVWLDPSRKRC